jgi:hypothetical protein
MKERKNEVLISFILSVHANDEIPQNILVSLVSTDPPIQRLLQIYSMSLHNLSS